MPIKDTLEGKITYRIKRCKTPVFVRDDFKDIGGYDQVVRILKGLVKKNQFISLVMEHMRALKDQALAAQLFQKCPCRNLQKSF